MNKSEVIEVFEHVVGSIQTKDGADELLGFDDIQKIVGGFSPQLFGVFSLDRIYDSIDAITYSSGDDECCASLVRVLYPGLSEHLLYNGSFSVDLLETYIMYTYLQFVSSINKTSVDDSKVTAEYLFRLNNLLDIFSGRCSVLLEVLNMGDRGLHEFGSINAHLKATPMCRPDEYLKRLRK